MTHDLTRYTVDVTSARAFGEDPNTLEQQGDAIQNHLAVIFPMIMSRINAPFPWWRHVRLPRDRRLDRAMVGGHRHVRDTMRRARQRMQDNPSDTPRNLLEAMLRMRDAPSPGVTGDDVAANVLTLLPAGVEMRLVLSMRMRNFSLRLAVWPNRRTVIGPSRSSSPLARFVFRPAYRLHGLPLCRPRRPAPAHRA